MAQEIIKVIIKQYIPIDNTCLFDGVGSKSGFTDFNDSLRVSTHGLERGAKNRTGIRTTE